MRTKQEHNSKDKKEVCDNKNECCPLFGIEKRTTKKTATGGVALHNANQRHTEHMSFVFVNVLETTCRIRLLKAHWYSSQVRGVSSFACGISGYIIYCMYKNTWLYMVIRTSFRVSCSTQSRSTIQGSTAMKQMLRKDKHKTQTG